jgi:hypothetical protein
MVFQQSLTDGQRLLKLYDMRSERVSKPSADSADSVEAGILRVQIRSKIDLPRPRKVVTTTARADLIAPCFPVPALDGVDL